MGFSRQEYWSAEVRREGREPLPDHAGESPLLSRSGGEKGLRGSGAGALGVPLGGTRRVGGLLGLCVSDSDRRVPAELGEESQASSCLPGRGPGERQTASGLRRTDRRWWAAFCGVAQSWNKVPEAGLGQPARVQGSVPWTSRGNRKHSM